MPIEDEEVFGKVKSAPLPSPYGYKFRTPVNLQTQMVFILATLNNFASFLGIPLIGIPLLLLLLLKLQQQLLLLLLLMMILLLPLLLLPLLIIKLITLITLIILIGLEFLEDILTGISMDDKKETNNTNDNNGGDDDERAVPIYDNVMLREIHTSLLTKILIDKIKNRSPIKFKYFNEAANDFEEEKVPPY